MNSVQNRNTKFCFVVVRFFFCLANACTEAPAPDVWIDSSDASEPEIVAASTGKSIDREFLDSSILAYRRRFSDGTEQIASMSEGPDGFAIATFGPGDTIASEMPNPLVPMSKEHVDKTGSIAIPTPKRRAATKPRAKGKSKATGQANAKNTFGWNSLYYKNGNRIGIKRKFGYYFLPWFCSFK